MEMGSSSAYASQQMSAASITTIGSKGRTNAYVSIVCLTTYVAQVLHQSWHQSVVGYASEHAQVGHACKLT